MSELTVPRVDFSALGELPDIYKKARSDALMQQTLANLGQGASADTDTLLKSGNLSLVQLGINARNRQEEQERQAQLDARQLERDKVSDQHWGASYALQKQAADRENRGIGETSSEREAVAIRYGIDPKSIEGQSFILTGKLPKIFGGEGGAEYGLNPAYGIDAEGRPAAIQFSTSGQAIQTKLPSGFTLSRQPVKVDTGTSTVLIDPVTRQEVGNVTKNVAAAEVEKEKGSAQGLAQVALPESMANSEQILKIIKQIDEHPGKKYSLGVYSKIPTVPGTSQADFRANIEQLQGQTFLQAYQKLRSGGAITDIEGKKGENAIARMQTSQSESSFNQALKDFKDVVESGMERAKAKASGNNYSTERKSTNINTTASGVKWSIE